MLLSRTTTAPTNFRSQVERVATSRAMFMKYSSQETRTRPLAGGGDSDVMRQGRLRRASRRHKPRGAGDIDKALAARHRMPRMKFRAPSVRRRTVATAWVLAAPAAGKVYADSDDRTVAEALVSQLDRLAHDAPARARITAEALSRT